MRSKNPIHLLLAVALFTWSCETGELLAPSVSPSDSEALLTSDHHGHHVAGPVDYTIPLTTTDPGDLQVVDGVIIVTNQINEGPISGDLEGHAVALFNARIDEITGLGSGRGTLTFYITAIRGKPVDAYFRGKFVGKVEQPLFFGTLETIGYGDLAGTKLISRFSEPNGDNVFQLEGKILKRHGHQLSH